MLDLNTLTRLNRHNITFADRCSAFNSNQTEPGTMLKTLKGSVIERYRKLGFGKKMSTKFYFHKDYIDRAFCNNIDGLLLLKLAQSVVDFDYNIVRWDSELKELALEEVPNFDTAREPIVGRVLVIDPYQVKPVSKPHRQILHHKWTLVDDSYSGFDVAESWEWSKIWLSILTEKADGSNIENWIKQLNRYNLE